MSTETLQTLFNTFNFMVMPIWFGFLFFPKKAWPKLICDIFFIFAALIFTMNLIPGIQELFPLVMNPTLPKVAEMLSVPQGAFGGWTHFLIGDLLAGRWILSDSQAKGIPHLFIAPILIFTLLFGPFGLLCFFLLRLIYSRKGTPNVTA